MLVLLVVPVLGLDGVGREEYRGLGRAVYVVRQDSVLHLKQVINEITEVRVKPALVRWRRLIKFDCPRTGTYPYQVATSSDK